MGRIVSSYPFPNNHVCFSLLAKATSSLAPFHPWALRLPAFLAGVAIVPLTWAVGRRFASAGVGLAGAALAAGSTSLILYSTNARGYSLVAAAVALALLSGGIALFGRAAARSDDTGVFPAARDVASRLVGELWPGDRVLAVIPTNGPLLYYFSAFGLDTALLNTPFEATRRAFVVLDPAEGHTLEWAVSRGIIDPASFQQPTPLMKRPDVEVWRSERR